MWKVREDILRRNSKFEVRSKGLYLTFAGYPFTGFPGAMSVLCPNIGAILWIKVCDLEKMYLPQ